MDKQQLDGQEWPPISILVPCCCEAEVIADTIEALAKLSYPHFEIIAVDDGSKERNPQDKTAEILTSLVKKHDCLRFIECRRNRGKANALHIAAHAANYEYLLCIDADAMLDDSAPYYMVRNFFRKGERLGAVTGNPRIRNRDCLLAKIQIVEYASIIGSIKRAQRVLGKIMTVSGVIVMFRKKALLDVHLWDRNMITEDIAVSWKLQKFFWDIRYEPRALCWMLVPETMKGLWKQRLRWAQGGQEVILRNFRIFFSWKQRRLWPVFLEEVVSVLWAVSWLIVTIYLIIHAKTSYELLIWLTFGAFAMVLLSVVQLLVSSHNDSKYDNVVKFNLWAVWYPAMYWIAHALLTIRAIPKSIWAVARGGYAVWDSPDRGNLKKTPEKEAVKSEAVENQKEAEKQENNYGG